MTANADLLAAAQRVDMDETPGATTADLDALAAKTPPDEIRQRQGPGGKTLDYVDARFVMNRLDSIVPGLWQRDHRMIEGGKVACGIGIFIRGLGWVWRWDGAGETDIEGEKGSFSDAFKRAAVSWGIARDLYPEPNAVSVPQNRPVPQRVEQPVRAEQAGYGESEADNPDICPIHHRPWKVGKKGGGFCSAKNADGTWCDQHAPHGWRPA